MARQGHIHSWLHSLFSDCRFALRQFRKSPGFTSVAILTLALGIGANTAIFTLINALLLRDLPVHQPQRLVRLRAVRPDAKVPFSYPMFREVERNQRVFTGLVGWSLGTLLNVDVNGVLQQNRVMAVTGNSYFELGVTPSLGRLFTPEDSNPGTADFNVAVLGYEFWQRRFGGASDVVGKQIRIEGHLFTIVGVTRKWFTGMTVGQPPDITVPITAYPSLTAGNQFTLGSRSILWISPMGRLKDRVTMEQARAQLQSFWPDVLLATASTETPSLRRQTFLSMGLELSSAERGFTGGLAEQFARPLYVLAAIVGLILLVACINLANLMLARAAARSHEMSVRVAIGASGWQLARQVLTESLVLSLAGALLALGFAYWGSRLLVLFMAGQGTAVSLDLTPDLRVLSCATCLAFLTGILFGLAPAWRSSREDPVALLQQNDRSIGGGSGGLGKLLIVAQISLSLILLLGAGLLVSSFEKLRNLDLGFRKESVFQFSLYPRPGGYQQLDMAAYHRQLLDRISALPGVSSVCLSTADIPSADVWHDSASVASSDPSSSVQVMTSAAQVSPGFFQTLGVRLLQGHSFKEADSQREPHVAVVSNGLARRLFPAGNPIGQRIRFSFMPETQNLEIVGIAEDTRLFNLRDPAAPAIYLSWFQFPESLGNLLVRTRESPEALEKTIAREIDSLGHEYPLSTRTVAEVVSSELTEQRVTAMLSAFFAALALLLASIGLYGLMSYAVTRRRREIGIRVALGAQRQNVLWIVLRETLLLAILGLAIGIPCAIAACRLISSLLFGLTSSDLPTIVAVSLLLLAVALFAGYLPARRAVSVDPLVSLRHE